MKSDNKSKPWQDEEVLRELYHERGMSMQDIADHFGDMTWGGIKYWMDKLDIDRRDRSDAAKKMWLKEPPSLITNGDGYPICQSQRGDMRDNVYLHRLLAVAEYGFDATVGMDVHHKNGVPWDNRPDNIELKTRSEHVRHHHAEGGT